MEQVALITGASSGFGLLSAVSLARRGLRVYASMRDLRRRGELDRAAAGTSLEVIELDVTRPESVERITDTVGPVDVLVNNAGIGIIGALENTSLGEMRQVFETNFFGAVAVTKAVLPGMRERRRGRIINVASVSGRIATPGTPAYIASKHALEGLSDSLRFEVAPFGIHVAVVEPGMFPTAMARSPWIAERSGGPYAAIEDALRAKMAEVCAKNAADPQQVADAIVEAATARAPRHRYIVGKDAVAAFVLRSVLPARVFSAMVRGMLTPKAGSRVRGTR